MDIDKTGNQIIPPGVKDVRIGRIKSMAVRKAAVRDGDVSGDKAAV